MTKKKDMTAAKLKKTKADNAVVYKSMVALALLCLGLFGLRTLRNYYSTVAGFDQLYPLSIWIAVAGLIILAGCAVGMVLSKKDMAHMILSWGIVFGFILCATGLAMRLSWTEDFGALYFLVCFLMLEYVILQLYRWEFFLFSLATSIAGFQFYQMSTGFSWNVWNIALLVITALVHILLAPTDVGGMHGVRTVGMAQQLTVFPEQQRFGAGGPDINTQEIFHQKLPLYTLIDHKDRLTRFSLFVNERQLLPARIV